MIVAINGQAISNAEQLNRMATYESHLGDRLEVTVLRDGAEMTVAVVFEVAP